MINKISKTFVLFAIISICLTASVFSQKTIDSSNLKDLMFPKVIKVDDKSIKEILKPNGKPLLVNFWATWCVPCREEFPELVELAHEYKGKIDLITISLDNLAEINRDVPKFLKDMKATMPAYLLKTNDENAVISSISKDWAGGLPFTVLYNRKGEIVHTRQGKFKIDILREKLNNLKGVKDAKKDLMNKKLLLKGNLCHSQVVTKSMYHRKRIAWGEIDKPLSKTDINEPTFELICRYSNDYKEI